MNKTVLDTTTRGQTMLELSRLDFLTLNSVYEIRMLDMLTGADSLQWSKTCAADEAVAVFHDACGNFPWLRLYFEA